MVDNFLPLSSVRGRGLSKREQQALDMTDV